MALTTADFFWVDTFKQIQKQTDLEIEALNVGLGQRARQVFASSLVESQRTSDDLRTHFRERKQSDINSILANEFCTELLKSSDLTVKDLTDDPLLRIFAKHALRYLDSLSETRADEVLRFRSCLGPGGNIELKTMGEPLRCLLKYIRDILLGRTTETESETGRDSSPGSTAKSKEEEETANTSTTFDKTTPESFQLEDVPRLELQKRLNRGEIAPRDEWIPSEDKKNKKTINSVELQARIAFGERLDSEAKTAMGKNDFELASTLYTQGVHLLDQYKCVGTADACDLLELLNKFRRNNAVANIKLGRYRQAISSCSDVLEDDEHDGKAKFLRAKALMAVGDLEAAENDLRNLMTDGFASDAHRKAGQEGLRQLRIEARRDRQKVATLLQGVTSETYFSSDRPTGQSESPDDKDAQSTGRPENDLASRERSPYDTGLRKTVSEALPMSPKKYIRLLEAMLRTYTFPAVAKRLEAIRHQVDYNERKIIIKLQSVLPGILMPIFEEFEICTQSDEYAVKKKELDRIIGMFQTSKQVTDDERKVSRSLLKSIREALVGGEETSS